MLLKTCSATIQRGKFRPRLVGLAESNSPEEVASSTRKAFQHVEQTQLKQAIDMLSKLKGLGPATASGTSQILSVRLYKS